MNSYQTKSVLTYLQVNSDYCHTAIKIAKAVTMSVSDVVEACKTLLELGEIIVTHKARDKGVLVNFYQYTKR